MVNIDEFADLISDPDTCNKLYSSPTVKISELVSELLGKQNMSKYRLVMSVKEKNGKRVVGNCLYFTPNSYFGSPTVDRDYDLTFTGVNSVSVKVKEYEE